MTNFAIIGAGLSGLIAAHAFPAAQIFEAGPRRESHHALLRFRTEKVSILTGIPFRRVVVRKGIWAANRFRAPDIAIANQYSTKCLDVISSRSIWDISPAERFIAPESFYEQLVDHLHGRVLWECAADFAGFRTPAISTAPMHVPVQALGWPEATEIAFTRRPITVQRWRVPFADVFQTIYFPDPDHTLYRASITGSLLIAEFAGDPSGPWAKALQQAFAIPKLFAHPIDSVTQSHGKISPIDEAARRSIIMRLTERHQIYSLGRFATWRNILLDDVVDDIGTIRRLMAASSYDRKLMGA